MERKNSSDFLKFCGDDIDKLHKETDPGKKTHLMRRISMQMYAEACKQNYDNHTICKMLSDDLDLYIKQSNPFHQRILEDKMKTLNIELKAGSIKSSLNTQRLDNLLMSKKCEGTCRNDLLLDELDKFFNSMKKRPNLNTSKSAAKPNTNDAGHTSKMDIDEYGDLVFDTNFKRKKFFQQNTSNSFQAATTSDNRQPNQDIRVVNNRVSITNRQNDHFKPAEANKSNIFNPYSSVKRKTDEPFNDCFKRPSVLSNSEPDRDDANPFVPRNDFLTATEELTIQYNKKYGAGNQNDNTAYNTNPNGGLRRSLGGRRTVNNKYVPPFANQDNTSTNSGQVDDSAFLGMDMNNPRLKNIDEKMIEAIRNEIVYKCDLVDWDSIAGLEYAKKILQEAVVLPILRPDIFIGLRQPPRGVLLFGPPGTGKTLIGKCIASQSNSTFFSISASSLTSKWIGEGEKMVRALFAVAAASQPSVVFIDEVDSLLCQRSESEHESSRRLKTEFLVQLDGTSTTEKDRILIVGATNRPQELDEAARRRFVKRLYIPLPDFLARKEILLHLLGSVNHVMSEAQLDEISQQTEGHSGADMKVLCQEAVMGPVRMISFSDMKNVRADSVRPVTFSDFLDALKCVRASVSQDDLQQYIDWNNKYGTGSGR